MGDLCVTIAKLTKLTARAAARRRSARGLREMGERAEQMIRVAIESLAGARRETRRVAARARRADRPCESPCRRTACSSSAADPEKREWGLRMIIVSRCLERIGDHAVDIGEQTAFLVTGEFREFTDATPMSGTRRVHHCVTGSQPRSQPTCSSDRLATEIRPLGMTAWTSREKEIKHEEAFSRARWRCRLSLAVAGSSPGGRMPTKAPGRLVGAGATFPFPLISKWIPEVDKAYGISITYSPDRLGRRHRGDHRPHRRLRRLRRAAVARPAQRRARAAS